MDLGEDVVYCLRLQKLDSEVREVISQAPPRRPGELHALHQPAAPRRQDGACEIAARQVGTRELRPAQV